MYLICHLDLVLPPQWSLNIVVLGGSFLLECVSVFSSFVNLSSADGRLNLFCHVAFVNSAVWDIHLPKVTQSYLSNFQIV